MGMPGWGRDKKIPAGGRDFFIVGGRGYGWVKITMRFQLFSP